MLMTRADAETILFREARLLDERSFEEWLEMFDEECLYWVPIVDGDPNVEPSIIYDDKQRMEERIFRLLETRAYAQEPPSRTQHNISNVEVLNGGEDGEVRVLCNLSILELRVGEPAQVGLGEQRLLAGRCEYVLVGEPDWRIKLKKVYLINRDLPLYNLTFIL